MIEMIIKMSLVTGAMCVLNVLVRKLAGDRINKPLVQVLIGIVFGGAAIASTHFGVDYEQMVLNVRDIAPLSAGLFFGPLAGILAGLIGGVERFVAGTFFSVGSYTVIACSVATALAGVVAALLNKFVFKGLKPSPGYALCFGGVTEVFHMLTVFLTHNEDLNRAFEVVHTCAIPMIIFTALGMAVSSVLLSIIPGGWKSFRPAEKSERSIATRFQQWLFIFIFALLSINFAFSFIIQTQQTEQTLRSDMDAAASDVARALDLHSTDTDVTDFQYIGNNGIIIVSDPNGVILSGIHVGENLDAYGCLRDNGEFFESDIMGVRTCCLMKTADANRILVAVPYDDAYRSRNISAYETAFGGILLFTLVYMMIYILVQKLIVINLDKINKSLSKITEGNLNEVVSVRSSVEFTSLSRDINSTVSTLKRYIADAENRMNEELEFARSIQISALPQNFKFPNRDEFNIYAVMYPAKEVGGDFYDFFFADKNKIALLIADVSGKGIPAALFMMRSKATIRSLAESGLEPDEIFRRANAVLCEGNSAEMFVTAWIGILDLETGVMKCANAGHEYPALRTEGGKFSLLKDKHGVVLGAVDIAKFKQYEVKLVPGDKVFVYTDGVAEATDSDNQLFGTDRMLDALNTAVVGTSEEILLTVKDCVDDFVGKAPQFDDLTMLCLEFFKYTDKN